MSDTCFTNIGIQTSLDAVEVHEVISKNVVSILDSKIEYYADIELDDEHIHEYLESAKKVCTQESVTKDLTDVLRIKDNGAVELYWQEGETNRTAFDLLVQRFAPYATTEFSMGVTGVIDKEEQNFWLNKAGEVSWSSPAT